MVYLHCILFGLLAFDVYTGCRRSRAMWREVATGSAGIHTLRLLTGISDRHELSRLFGEPDETFRYEVSRRQVDHAITRMRRILDNGWVEPLFLVAALVAAGNAILRSADAYSLVTLGAAFLYLAIRSGWTLFVLLRSHRQRLEEGRAKLRLARGMEPLGRTPRVSR